MRIFPVALALALGSANHVVGQTMPAMYGEWFGVIRNYDQGEPRRKFVLSTSCTWTTFTKGAPDAAQCVVSDRKVSVTTIAGSHVELTGDATTLSGRFTLKNGQSYDIAMVRNPDQIPDWATATSAPAHAEPDSQWTVQGIVVPGSPSNCGFTDRRKITIKNNVLVAMSEGGGAWTLSNLDKRLKPDGSGHLVGNTERGQHKVSFDFVAGTGPRQITMRFEDSGCAYNWTPDKPR
jgi:hypothetical protein